MSTAAPSLATYEDLLTLPPDTHAEILGGRIVTEPAPLPKHSSAQGSLRRFVGGPFHDDHGRGGPGGWWIFAEVDIQLGRHDVVRPDLAGWRRTRLPNPANLRPIALAPDWVCEVLSPSTVSRDKVTKLNLYAEHGVGHYWIVDTDARTLEVLELHEGHWWIRGSYDDTASARVPPFEAIELVVDRLFLPREE